MKVANCYLWLFALFALGCNSLEYKLLIINNHINEFKCSLAEKELNLIAQRKQQNVEYYNLLTKLRMNQGQPYKAIHSAKKALKLSNKSDVTYYNLGWALFYTGQFSKSRWAFNRTVKKAPNARWLHNSANWYLSKIDEIEYYLKDNRAEGKILATIEDENKDFRIISKISKNCIDCYKTIEYIFKDKSERDILLNIVNKEKLIEELNDDEDLVSFKVIESDYKHIKYKGKWFYRNRDVFFTAERKLKTSGKVHLTMQIQEECYKRQASATYSVRKIKNGSVLIIEWDYNLIDIVDLVYRLKDWVQKE